MKQVNSQSDLISMSSFAGPSYLTIRSCLHHFNLGSLYLQSLQSLPNWIQLYTSEISPMCTQFHWTNNKSTLPSVTVFYQANSSSSYFTVERAAKTLHRMSPCMPVSVPAKITWMVVTTSHTFKHILFLSVVFFISFLLFICYISFF